MGGKRVTATAEEMLALREQGMSNEEIAEEIGATSRTVLNRIGKQPEWITFKNVKKGQKGARPKPQKAPPKSPEKPVRKRTTVTTEEMLDLRKAGLSNQEIADKLQISYGIVFRRIGKQPEALTSEHAAKNAEKGRAALAAKRAQKNVIVEVETPSKNVIEGPEKVEAPKKKAPIYYIDTELGGFAYLPNFYEKLHDLKEMAQPESWRFVESEMNNNDNPETPILVPHLTRVFRFMAILHNQTPIGDDARIIQMKGNTACFHTGLYTPELKGIYARLSRNRQPGRQPWVLNVFGTDTEEGLRTIHPLPEPPSKLFTSLGAFHPEKDIRVSVEHILRAPKNLERVPESLRDNWNLPMILWASIEHSRRRARIEPSIVVPALAIGRTDLRIEYHYLLPLWITNPDAPDLVLAVKECDGYYGGFTCLTPAMAYMNARLYGRPTAKWLTDLLEE